MHRSEIVMGHPGELIMKQLVVFIGLMMGTMLNMSSAQAESADGYSRSLSQGPPYVFGWFNYPEPT